jgi:glycosyltransferase involved in cell wall biosynthesis
MDGQSLYVGLPSGDYYGWGVCGRYLKQELAKKVNCTFLEKDQESTIKLPGIFFTALKNQTFLPFINALGRENYGYTFFENKLPEICKANAGKYNLIFCGSAWCSEKLLAAGIENKVLIQGIDPEIFYPITREKRKDTFVIYSGGKFELRKGQDLVLKAVKILQDKYDDIFMINSWNNFWPESLKTMQYSSHIKFEIKGKGWKEIMDNLYFINGLDQSRIETLEIVPYEQQREIFAMTDIGIFPNRCEGGTNLVMMEYMACGKPVIASYTSGHKDILNPENSFLLTDLKDYSIAAEPWIEWQEASLEDLVDKIEYAYHNREKIRETGKRAGGHLKNFTWEKSAGQLLEYINRQGKN